MRKFSTVEEIFKEFFETRKKKYIERKAFQEGMLRAQSERLSNQVVFCWILPLDKFLYWRSVLNLIKKYNLQARFILAKIKGEIYIENKRKVAIVEQLVKKGFDPDPVKKWKEYVRKKELEMTGEVAIDEEDEEEEGTEEVFFNFLFDSGNRED